MQFNYIYFFFNTPTAPEHDHKNICCTSTENLKTTRTIYKEKQSPWKGFAIV